MENVLVLHPGQQHSHQLAWAVSDAGRLLKYVSGVPVLAPGENAPYWLPSRFARRLKIVPISKAKRLHPIGFYGLIRVAQSIYLGQDRGDNVHRAFYVFDKWASSLVLRLRPDVVVAYENSAMRTFEAARKIGAFCILDAPSIEHKAASNLLQLQPTPHELEINRRKDREVALADLILTCSKLAAQTYLDAGVASDKVRSVLLGATAPQSLAGRFTGNQTTRFVFAGRFTYRKSADLLLSVFRRLNQEGEDATLEILGNAGDEGYLGEIANSRNIKYHGHVNQEFLFSAIAAADCLLLPSRFDAFGMVVAEALTVGTPVIISDATGACEILQNHPNCGWITEASEESLYECIRARLKNRAELARAREHAKVAGLSLDWSVYRSRIAKIMRDVDLAKSGR